MRQILLTIRYMEELSSFVNSLQQKDIEYQFWIPLLPSICIAENIDLLSYWWPLAMMTKNVVEVK